MSTKRRSILVAAWAAVVMGLGAVGETAAQEKVTLRLDWVNSGYHAIWYYGIDKGIFKGAGIDLEVLEGRGSAITTQTVGNGSVMFGTADSGAVMGLVAQGIPVKIVSGYLRRSPIAVIYPKQANWKSYADMSGARIGYSPGGSGVLFRAVLKAAGLEGKVQLINMEPNAKPQALLEGRIDCFESFDFLQIPLLEEHGMPSASLPISLVGIHVPGLSLIASHDMIKKNPQLVRKMTGLMRAAIEASRSDPNAAIDSLLKRAPTLNRRVVTRVLTLSFDLLEPDWAKDKPFGWMSPEIIESSQDLLIQYEQIKTKRAASDYITNDFIAPK
jgi:NitT/TauT family transport system substrate-binding protein